METDFEIVAQRVDVLRQQIVPTRVVVRAGRIAALETVASAPHYLLPGFVDAHVHVESSMLTPVEFARAAVVHGSVAAVSDPHEIANVCGMAGVEAMLTNAAQTPFGFHFGAPSCVPATPFETAGAHLGLAEVRQLLADPRIGYLSEVMDFPGVISGRAEVCGKIDAALELGLPVDGHAPGLRGEELTRYLQAGISTDHETVELHEGLEKIAHGAKILIREGSAARNFDALAPLLREHADACMFCSDDKHPDDLLAGHINQLVARALALGYDLFRVLHAACVHPVHHYGLDLGLLQLGDPADFVIVEDLVHFRPRATYLRGTCVASAGDSHLPPVATETINHFAAPPISADAVQVPAKSNRVRVMEVEDGQLTTLASTGAPAQQHGFLRPDPGADLLKLAVVNRYQAASPQVGFVRHVGLKRGALASSVAHDSHNVVAVGTTDDDLVRAINAVLEQRGGLAATLGDTVHLLPLPIAGLMANGDCQTVGGAYERLDRFAKDVLGSTLSAPFMTLSFLALPVIPQLKLTDRGLFDVEKFDFVSLYI